MRAGAAQSQTLMRNNAAFEKGIEFGFDSACAPDRLILGILDRGLNPAEDQRGFPISFGLRSNLVTASKGESY